LSKKTSAPSAQAARKSVAKVGERRFSVAENPSSSSRIRFSSSEPVADAARGGRHHDGVIRGDLAHLQHSEAGGKSVMPE
jgi:hypothetical protein